MKITVLMENRAEGKFVGEHGLSICIEYKGKNYLLDTGASDQFLTNSEVLGIDIENIDVAALSHSHYDHSGGYNGFFNRNSKAKVYLRSEAKEKCYEKIGFIKKYIGIPKGMLQKYSNRFVYVDGDYQIEDGVWLIPHKTPNLELKGKQAHMYRQTKYGLIPDDFSHEQSLVFDTEKGLVIFNSCCHSGVDNVVAEVKDTFKNREVLAIIGGFHLMGLFGPKTMSGKSENIRELGKTLMELGVKKIYTGHCTGEPAFRILQEVCGTTLHSINTGFIVEL